MEALTGDDFPACEFVAMSASRFGRKFHNLFSITVVISSATLFSARVCLGQTNPNAARRNYVVSVQDLKMASKGRAAFDKGTQMLQKGDAVGSVAYFEKAIAEYPEHYKAYYDLGVAHLRLSHLTEAEQALQKAIDLTKGNFAPPQFGLGAILCEKSEFPQAERLLQRAVDLEPGSAVGKYYLGWAQYGLNRLIEAERSLEQALLRNTNFAQAYILLTRIHLRQHNLPAANQDLESYLKIEPQKEQARILADHIKQEMAQDAAAVADVRPQID
jgi:tetratricopeptide (TPR) repeat protein